MTDVCQPQLFKPLQCHSNCFMQQKQKDMMGFLLYMCSITYHLKHWYVM